MSGATLSPEVVPGGIGDAAELRRPTRGFWGDARSLAMRRPGAAAAVAWLGVVALLAAIAPLLASGHPLILRGLDSGGTVTQTTSPLLRHLTAADVLWLGLLLTATAFAWAGPARRATTGLIGAQLVATMIVQALVRPWLGTVSSAIVAAVLTALSFMIIALRHRNPRRVLIALAVGIACGAVIWLKGSEPLPRFDYRQREAAGQVRCVYTAVPFSPSQGDPSRYLKPPGFRAPPVRPSAEDGPRFLLGTDPLGQDVLSQLLHACRLSLTIGLVSTGIATAIGVTIGALAGYLGGWVDVILQRLIEVFMGIPVLFLVIVAAGLLPAGMRSTHITMTLIGLVTWTGAARFTRAEFLKLRTQDFVLAARAAGLGTRSILFRHMLPSGITPVLVEASFTIAGAILAEATLSFLGLGPIDQPSWGKLLSSATDATGTFVWWLAVFPGLAIFLTVLSYNVLGNALRDAMDPKERMTR